MHVRMRFSVVFKEVIIESMIIKLKKKKQKTKVLQKKCDIKVFTNTNQIFYMNSYNKSYKFTGISPEEVWWT